MDFELRAGAHLTLISSKEFADEMEKVTLKVADLLRQESGETIVDQAPPFKTNSSGNGSGLVYRIPVGYDGYLVRLVVDWPGASAKTGGTACTVRVSSDPTAASTRSVNNTVPSVLSTSRSHAALFRGGQSVFVTVTGGPPTQTLFCSVQVVLVRRKPLATDTLEAEGFGS